MSLSTVAMAALLVFTAAAVAVLATSFFRGLSAEQTALGQLARELAADGGAVEAWGRGFAIDGARERLAFRPDVFTSGELRSGVVDVWRVQLSTRGLPRKTSLVFTNKPAVKGDRVVDDVEGRSLERAGWRASDDSIAAGVLGPGPFARATGALLGKWRVRGLSIAADGTLDVSVERDTATQRELTNLLDDVRSLASSIEQLSPRLAERATDDPQLVSLGPASGEPIPVGSRLRSPNNTAG
jgi:hypothetical protein